MFRVNLLDKLSFLLVLIGSINWGFIGLLNYNLLRALCFDNPLVERMLYILVFLSSIKLITLLFKLLIPSKNFINSNS